MRIKKKDDIRKRRRWRGGEGRETREGQCERRSEEEFRDKKREERKYTNRKMRHMNGLGDLQYAGFVATISCMTSLLALLTPYN